MRLKIVGAKILVLDATQIEELPDHINVEDVVAQENQRLRETMREVYAINEKGGPGSRRMVKELLAPFFQKAS